MESSTLEVCLKCFSCGKYLKETEVYFYYNECSECIDRELEDMKEN